MGCSGCMPVASVAAATVAIAAAAKPTVAIAAAAVAEPASA